MEVEKIPFEYFNPIEKTINVLNIQRLILNRTRLNTLQPYKNDDDVYNILNGLLKELDLTKTVFGMLKCTTDSVRYASLLSEYVYYVEHLENHLKWNDCIDRLFVQHAINLIFEKEFTPPEQPKKGKNKSSTDKRPPNKYIRRETIDLFSEEHVFEYYNPRTGDIIKSNDPNLADKLNAEIEKLNNKNKGTKPKGERRERIERAKVVRTPDFSKMKFKF